MKIWKIVSGILSILISAYVVYQSVFAGLLDILSANGESSGTAGLIVAAALLSGGIISLVTRNGSRGGGIAMAILYGVGGAVGLILAGSYWDLRVWSLWALLCMVLAMVEIGTAGNEPEEDEPEPESAAPAPPQPVRSAPVRRASARPAPATLQQVLTEEDPQKRDAAIDALPERAAKSYLKEVLNVFGGRRDEDEDETSASLVRTLIVVLAVVGLALVAVMAVALFTSLGIGPAAPARPSSAAQTTPDSRQTASVQPSQQAQPTARPIPGSGTLGDSYVQIQGAFLTSDYQGNPAVVVTYAWTNNGPETTSAMAELNEQTFQNGVELGMATITSSQRYQSGTSLREVRPGAQTQVQCAFLLSNTTSPIEFELSEFMGGSGAVVYASFDLAALEREG